MCSYAAFDPSMGIAVRTSVGFPKMWRGPKLEYARRCAPAGIFGIVTDRDAFTTAYLARLDERPGEVAGELALIARRHNAQRLVLLCYENLSIGQWCHRTLLASWLEDHTGAEVPELGPPPAPPPQGTLL